MLYYFIPIYAFLVYFIGYLINPKGVYGTLWNILSLLPIILFLSYIAIFRDISIGTDTENYEKIFLQSEEGIEFSYIFLSDFVKSIGGDFRLFIFFVFLLAFCSKLFSFFKASYSLHLSLLIYSGMWYLVYDMNGIRQGMALGFICISYYFIFNSKIIYSFIFTCIASCFHYTAIIFIPFLLIHKIKCSKKILYLILLFSLVLGGINFSEVIISFLSNFQYLQLRLIDRVLSYQADELFNTNVFYSFKTVSRLFIIFIVIFFIDKINADKQYKNIVLWGMLINFFIYCIFSQYEIIGVRLSLYYRLSEIFFFSMLPLAFKNNISRVIVVGLLCLYVSLNVYQILSLPNNNLYPYKSFISII
ncbi:EpsG family protein [Gallibacterium melopsittaci]|uniref:EpsG family protein n=1 Tax=Gallibacterium melopsittaci TaxID=516063 RepID=A0ABV6HSY8_9PAST